MRRVSVLVSLLAVLLVGVALGARFGAGALAQDATPPADEFELPEGVSFEALGYGTAEELPAAPADVSLFRVGFEPGAGFELDPEASLALAYVEEGRAHRRRRRPDDGAARGRCRDAVPDGDGDLRGRGGVHHGGGDSALFPAGGGGEVRNEGDEPAAVLVADITPLEEEEAGTPEAAGTPAS